MNETLKSYFSLVDDAILFKKTIGVIKIPHLYIERKITLFENEEVETLGIFDLYVWEDEDDFDNYSKSTKINFSIPTTIKLCPRTITEKTIEIVVDDLPEKSKEYELLFDFDSILIKNINTVMDSKNVVLFMNLLMNGKIPKEIKYDDIVKLWIECNKINNVKLNSPYSILDIIVRILCRDKRDNTILFANTLNKNPSISMNSYSMIRMTDIPRYTGAFPALSSGDPVSGITKSISDQRNGKYIQISPIEKLIS